MKVPLTIAGLALMFVLTIASLPWMLWAIGRAAFGDDAGFDRAMEASPPNRYWDWVEGVRRS